MNRWTVLQVGRAYEIRFRDLDSGRRVDIDARRPTDAAG